jgi:type II secretory pathway pseudopilin PulG
MIARTSTGRAGASLIELLVVLFIMGLMMGLLFPAIQNARARVNVTVCQNNVHQLQHALIQFIQAKKRFPLPGRWSVDLLPWIEQRELAVAIEANRDPNAKFDRPKLFHCPLQADFESRRPGMGVCHYMLVVDRQALLQDDDASVGWEIQDRPLLDDDVAEEPWYIGPEVLPMVRDEMMANLPGPHQAGAYGH